MPTHSAASASGGKQFLILLWKNLRLKWHSTFTTFLEIGMPAFFMLLLSIGYWLASDPFTPAQNYFNPYINPSVTIRDLSIFCSEVPETQIGMNISDCIDPGYMSNLPKPLNDVKVSRAELNPLVAAFGVLESPTVPFDFDTYVAISWAYHMWHGNGFLARGGRVSFLHSGYLGFIGRRSVIESFLQYCINTTFLCSRLTSEEFMWEFAEDAEAYAVTHGDKMWAIIDLRNLNNLEFQIRMNWTATPYTYYTIDQFHVGIGKREYMMYLNSGFVTLQMMMSNYLLLQHYEERPPSSAPTLKAEDLAFAPFPTKAFQASDFMLRCGKFVPLVVTFGFLYTLSKLLSNIVEEKETRIRQAMLIMGLSSTAFNASWLITSFIINFLASFFGTIVAKATIYNGVDFFLLLLLNVCFGFTMTGLGLLMTPFFSKSRISAIIGPLIMFITTVPHYAIPPGTANKYIILASILPCTAYAQAIQGMTQVVADFGHVGWKSFFVGEFSYGLSVFLMLADTGIYVFIAWYLDNVLPSEYGVRRPVWFLFLPSYWCGSRRNRGKGTSVVSSNTVLHQEDPTSSSSLMGNVEPVPKGVEPLVSVRNLRKEFKKDNGELVIAVDNMNLNLHMNHIEVLLGHNGAGKTTLMHMLVGLIPCTNGEIRLDDFTAADDMAEIRKRIGFCPQHNVLWSELSVKDHLTFYAYMKGVHWKDVPRVVEKIAFDVELTEKMDSPSKYLSGGQKRKLCVGISLCGDSPLLVLDEPTAGMDVRARRSIWDVLLEAKTNTNRCVLLSTHYMDEADILGDRISFMHRGKLFCSGSPLFLKSKMSVGYTLHCVVDTSADVTTLDGTVNRYIEESSNLSKEDRSKENEEARTPPQLTDGSNAVTTSKQQSTQNAIHSFHSTCDVAYRLPMSLDTTIISLFSHLEEKGKELYGLRSFGVSLTTMEDVFMKIVSVDTSVGNPSHVVEVAISLSRMSLSQDQVASPESDATSPPCEPQPPQNQAQIAGSATKSLQSTQSNSSAKKYMMSPLDSSSPLFAPVLEDPSFLRHFPAMFKKRFHCAKRDRRTWCFQVAMPIIFLVFALLLLSLRPPKQPSLRLDPTLYEKYNQHPPEQVLYTAAGDQSYFHKTPLFTPRSQYVMQGPIPVNYTFSGAEELSNVLARDVLNHSIHRYIAFATIGHYFDVPTPTTTLMHNSTATHALPQALSAWYSAIYGQMVNYTNAPITTVNNPLPMSNDEKRMLDSIQQIVGAIIILIPFTFIPANFVCFIVKEKECKARHLQWISGASTAAYWIASLCWDVLSYLVTEGLAMILFLIFNREEYIGDWETAAATFCLFFMYALAAIPSSYIVSFLFEKHTTAQNIVMMGNFFFGFLLVMAAQILGAISTTKDINQHLTRFYRVIPSYCLGEGIITLTGRKLSGMLIGEEPPAFSMLQYDSKFGNFVGGVGTSLTYLGITGPVFFLSLFLIERWRYVQVKMMRAKELRSAAEDENSTGDKLVTEETTLLATSASNQAAWEDNVEAEDPDVTLERTQVLQGRPTDALVVKKLKKAFKQKVAVNGVTFGIKQDEIFGLLGVNGAGKTTTISILTGELVPSSGTCIINGIDVTEHPDDARKLIGYCPQFDALLEHMTPEEHLWFFARLRGLPEASIAEMVEALLIKMHLILYRSTMARSLSGGNKRKLSIAIALVGAPPLLLLDEPSAGMDVAARRELWETIKGIATSRSVILTTHHLEEVEALAQRVAMMVDGQLKCIGTLQHVKSKFGGGQYEVQFMLPGPPREHGNTSSESFQPSSRRTHSNNAAQDSLEFSHFNRSGVDTAQAFDQIQTQFRNAFPNCIHGRFEINGRRMSTSVQDVTVSKIFSVMEKFKNEGLINDYTVNQTTLEQVFLRVSRATLEDISSPSKGDRDE